MKTIFNSTRSGREVEGYLSALSAKRPFHGHVAESVDATVPRTPKALIALVGVARKGQDRRTLLHSNQMVDSQCSGITLWNSRCPTRAEWRAGSSPAMSSASPAVNSFGAPRPLSELLTALIRADRRVRASENKPCKLTPRRPLWDKLYTDSQPCLSAYLFDTAEVRSPLGWFRLVAANPSAVSHLILSAMRRKSDRRRHSDGAGRGPGVDGRGGAGTGVEN